MAITFKVKEQKLATARGEQTFCYAKAISNGETSIEQLQKLIAKISAISEGDVRSVLMTLTHLVSLELAQGRIVSLGELGRLRVGLKSKGGNAKEKFRTQNIQKARVIFVPGSLIKDSLLTASFRRAAVGTGKCEATNGTTPSGGAKSEPNSNGSAEEDKPSNGYTGL